MMPGRGARSRLALAAVVALTLAGQGCSGRNGDRDEGRATSTTAEGAGPVPSGDGDGAGDRPAEEVEVGDRRRGGSARVGVWAEPDPAAATQGGAAVRALVLPQLFVARPDGRWSPSLVEPGTDRLAPDRRSAAFRLRPGAAWSDGSPIGAADLRRTADPRFVAGVDGPAGDGTVTVSFTQELPGWRRLWSGDDSVGAPSAGVWGGPFVMAGRTPGLEAVLRRNERWTGPGPFLDEVRLVLVPDQTTARQLLDRGELDAVMPTAATARIRQLEAVAGVSVDRSEAGGWSVELVMNPERMSGADRRALASTVDRPAFVATLLDGEASLADGLAGARTGPWAGAGAGRAKALEGDVVELTGYLEEPMTYLLHRSMQRRAGADGGRVELRQAEADQVDAWLAERGYQAAVAVHLSQPDPCWRCRWGDVEGDLATAADAGQPGAVAALQARLREEAVVLPLWTPTTVVAWRDGLNGPAANGYAASAAWNAWEWWREG